MSRALAQARLIDQPVVRKRLIAAIAAEPVDGPLHLGRVRSTLISGADVMRAIRELIDAGQLDPATLRPLPLAKTDGRGFKIADGEPARPLFDRVKGEVERRRIMLQTASIEIFGHRARLWKLTEFEVVRRATADKITAWLERSAEQPDGAAIKPVGKGRASILAGPLADEIETFLATAAIGKTRFEREVCRTPAAIKKMKSPGATVKPATAIRIRAFIDQHTAAAGVASAGGGDREPASSETPAPAPTPAQPPPAKPREWSDVEPGQPLREIRKFCDAKGMKLTRFGRGAVNDNNLCKRLEKADSVTIGIVERVRTFIAEQSKPIEQMLPPPVPGVIEVKGVVGLPLREAVISPPPEAPPAAIVEPVDLSRPRPTFLKPGEVAWCIQCEQRIASGKAATCRSPWCGLKEKAA